MSDDPLLPLQYWTPMRIAVAVLAVAAVVAAGLLLWL
jgi:hypothetical protein